MADTTGKTGKVGDLLVESGLLSAEELQEGMDLSGTLGLPIGKTMVMLGVLSERIIRSTVLLQSMLKDGLLEKDMAIKALVKSNDEGVPIEDCLIELGWRSLADLGANKVGELLVQAGAITKEQLQDVLEQVNTMGLPLCRVLVLTGKVKSAAVWCALNAQVLLRDKKISRQQALNAVKAVLERQTSVKGLDDVMPARKVRLGELLVLSGLVGEEEILGAVEESVLQDVPLGQVLVRQGLISRERLSDALKVQEMVDGKTLSPLQAVDVLRTVQNRNYSLQRAIAELGLLRPERLESLKLGEVLQMCGWITEQDIDEAVTLAAKNSNLLGKMLVACGFIDETMLLNSLRCQFLMREGFVEQDKAIIALHYSQRTRCSMDEAMLELGYTKDTAKEENLEAGSSQNQAVQGAAGVGSNGGTPALDEFKKSFADLEREDETQLP
jgi:hypothetical protein